MTSRSATAQVASWAERAREATARRNKAIWLMRAQGHTLRQIASAAGLTHAGVARILTTSTKENP